MLFLPNLLKHRHDLRKTEVQQVNDFSQPQQDRPATKVDAQQISAIGILMATTRIKAAIVPMMKVIQAAIFSNFATSFFITPP